MHEALTFLPLVSKCGFNAAARHPASALVLYLQVFLCGHILIARHTASVKVAPRRSDNQSRLRGVVIGDAR